MDYQKLFERVDRIELEITRLAKIGTNLVVADGDYYDVLNLGDELLNLSGGKNEVVIDSLGRPNIMVNCPINQEARLDWLSNNNTLWTRSNRALHAAFYVNGAPRAFQVAKYLAGKNGSTNTPVSLRGLVPSNSLTLDQMLSLFTAQGSDFTLCTNAIWAWHVLRSMRLAFQERGNSLYGKSDQALEYGDCATVIGTNADVYNTLTGSGPLAWRNLGDIFGPADFVGNVLERHGDFKLVDGKWRLIPDNNAAVVGVDMSSASTLFKELSQTGIYVDAGTAGTLCYDYIADAPVSGTAGFEISDAVTHQQANSDPYGTISFQSLGNRDGVTIPAIAKELLLAPCTSAPRGQVYMRNLGERCPYVGGAPNHGSGAGLGCRNSYNERSVAALGIGFRSCRLI